MPKRERLGHSLPELREQQGPPQPGPKWGLSITPLGKDYTILEDTIGASLLLGALLAGVFRLGRVRRENGIHGHG